MLKSLTVLANDIGSAIQPAPPVAERSDGELLDEYAVARSDGAFAQLVNRHAPWVYSSALRQVGKRNPDLHAESIAVANEIYALGTKPAKWIATDALRQLQSPKVHFKNYPSDVYGK